MDELQRRELLHRRIKVEKGIYIDELEVWRVNEVSIVVERLYIVAGGSKKVSL